MTTARKLFRLLSPSKRRASTTLLGLMLIGMVMETLGISLVFPALTLMTETDLAARYPALSPWLDRLGNPSQGELAIFGMLMLVTVFAVKTLFLAILAWRQAAFVWGLSTAIESCTGLAIENCTLGGGDEPLVRRFLLCSCSLSLRG